MFLWLGALSLLVIPTLFLSFSLSFDLSLSLSLSFCFVHFFWVGPDEINHNGAVVIWNYRFPFWCAALDWVCARDLPSFSGLHRIYRVWLDLTGFFLVLLGFTGFYWVLSSFIEFYMVIFFLTKLFYCAIEFDLVWLSLLGFTGFYLVLPGLLGVTELRWALLGFTEFYRVLQGYFLSYKVFLDCAIEFDLVWLSLLGFTGFYWFNWFLPVFTGCY